MDRSPAGRPAVADSGGPAPSPEVIVESVPARAALAGNPSDGYGGAVVAVPVRSARATVTVRPAHRFEIAHSPTEDDTFDDWAALRDHLGRFGASGRRELVLAAIDTFASASGAHLEPCAIEVETTIPRSVGLAGSSAIVIAAIRALARHGGTGELDPDRLAGLALAVEVEGLGIAAGLQDRVVQCYDASVLMEFGPAARRTVDGRPAGSYRRVPVAGPVRPFVAHLADAAAPSGATHGPLRARYEAGDPTVRSAMDELAGLARRATDALASGDVAALGGAMDRSFDVRRSIVAVHPRHAEMVERARAAGASANSAGSGGAIVVVGTEESTTRARSSLAGMGARFLDVPLS